jgi:hypothetical protein
LETVRIAFVDVPNLLQDLSIGLLARKSGIDVDPYELDPRDLPAAVAAGEVGVLVAGPRLADPEEICKLLMSHPRLKALVLSDEHRCAAFFELRPNRELRELSAQMLVDVVRDSRRPCADELDDEGLDPDREGRLA